MIGEQPFRGVPTTDDAQSSAERRVDRLYQLYRDPVYAFLVHFCRDPFDAEDLVQETFLKWKATSSSPVSILRGR